jgi:NAD(P)-dependent dehydrogenase (short-subunit alcohol dehydrogenase family)
VGEFTAGLRVAHLDLADPASVDRFVADWSGPLHILVDNAGVMATPETRTPQGRELQFATNHLGHFQLTADRPFRTPRESGGASPRTRWIRRKPPGSGSFP